MAKETALKCPQCGELDAVRKVSATYNGGFSTAQNNSPLVPYGVVDKTITTITPLAQKLTPPTQPNVKKPVESGAPRPLRIVFVAIAILSGVWLIYTGSKVEISGESLSLIFFGGVLAIFFPIVFFVGDANIRSGKTRQVFNANMETYRNIISKYELAKFRWDSAYYCGRCDGVFIPNENEFTSINQFNRFIHKFDT